MTLENQFDDIRPYNESELHPILIELINDPEFQPILQYIFKDAETIKSVKKGLSSVTSVLEFQTQFMYPLIKDILVKSTDGIFCSGIENIDKNKNYLFISNHRDIILDAAFMNMLMHEQGLKTTEIAIGSNLLIFDWIDKLVRINRSFIVKRNIPLKQMLIASHQLSAYIRHTIAEQDRSVWIAQREGRTKNGNDLTQTAVLKMLHSSHTGSFSDGFKQLQIVPLSISYEIEPCGNEKVNELLMRQENPCYQKTPKDDLIAMAGGLKNAKGKVNFSFGKPIDFSTYESIEQNYKGLNDQLNALAIVINKNIHQNYRLWSNNFIAYDVFRNTSKYFEEGKYTLEQKEAFFNLMETRLELLGDRKEAGKPLWMSMYAYPVINFEEASL